MRFRAWHTAPCLFEPVSPLGHGCYITDPAGVLTGLHAYDPEA